MMVMKRMHKNFIIFILLSLSLLLFIPFDGYDKCLRQEKFESLAFEGIVTRRFLDATQHSTPIVEFEHIKTGILDTVYFHGDKSNIFYTIYDLDTLSK